MVLYLCMLPVLLRFLWGRGMFNLQYAFYWSVFEWCMVLLYVAIGLCIWTLADPLVFRRDKLLSLMVLFGHFDHADRKQQRNISEYE